MSGHEQPLRYGTPPITFPAHIAPIITALERRDYLRDPGFDLAPSTICSVCRGWSSPAHYAFFAAVRDAAPFSDRWLVLGVYEGRDIAFIKDHAPDTHITGIDLFSDGPCNDWPEEIRGKTWEEAGMGPPPTIERARANLEKLGLAEDVMLIRGDDAAVLPTLAANGVKFDVIYIDTSHDYATVARQIQQVRALCHEKTILCGDDYQPRETWDVRRAVCEALPLHAVFGDTIWLAGLQ